MLVGESRGLKLPNFYESQTFNLIITKEIKKLSARIYSLLDYCEEYILEVLKSFSETAFEPYPLLLNSVKSELTKSITEQKNVSFKLIESLLQCEYSNQWTVNPYYIDIFHKVREEIRLYKESKKNHNLINTSLFGNTNNFTNMIDNNEIKIYDCEFISKEIFSLNVLNAITEEEIYVLNLQISCYAYWKVFQKRFVDYYQLIILHNFLTFYHKNLTKTLERIFNEKFLIENDLIVEREDIAEKRLGINSRLLALENAQREINKII